MNILLEMEVNLIRELLYLIDNKIAVSINESAETNMADELGYFDQRGRKQ